MIPKLTIMNKPTVRLVFDRKHTASKTKKGLVQLEITFKGKRKWASTGVRLYKDQWNERLHVVKSLDAIELNEWLSKQVLSLEKWLRDIPSFSWEALNERLNAGEDNDNFIDFINKTINERNDIRESTRKVHKKLPTILKQYGKITYFKDLTSDRILDFDNWLHGRQVRKLGNDGIERMETMRQQTIYSYHKLMKTYINKAVQTGLMSASPYAALHFKRGESEPDRYLTGDELQKLSEAVMRNGSVARSRDMFLFQCYTGLSYADLKEFEYANVKTSDGKLLYTGKRKKTGVPFYFVILPKALDILKKYDYNLPVTSIEAMNHNLKNAARDAGIDKPISTHWARRTAAMAFANHGIRMEVVAKILGHATSLTTEKYYADITAETVAKEIDDAGI